MIKTMKIRKCIFVDAVCNVSYYILATEHSDGRFRGRPPFVLRNMYFDTKEEAEAYLEEWNKDHVFFGYMEVCEKITVLE